MTMRAQHVEIPALCARWKQSRSGALSRVPDDVVACPSGEISEDLRCGSHEDSSAVSGSAGGCAAAGDFGRVTAVAQA